MPLPYQCGWEVKSPVRATIIIEPINQNNCPVSVIRLGLFPNGNDGTVPEFVPKG